MFKRDNPEKEGRYLVLAEATGGDQFNMNGTLRNESYKYICCGVFQFNRWMIDKAIVFIPNNSISNVVGWMELPEVLEAG